MPLSPRLFKPGVASQWRFALRRSKLCPLTHSSSCEATDMAWLFERTIELAAWVALVLGLVFLAGAVYYFVHGVQAWMNSSPQEAADLLVQAAIAASAFVLSSV